MIVKIALLVVLGVIIFMLTAAPGGVSQYKHRDGAGTTIIAGPHEGGGPQVRPNGWTWDED